MGQTRRINFVFGAQGGQVIATLNRIRSGIISTGNAANQSNRNLGLFNRTLHSIGTTMRYAFAGSVVYGIAQTVTLLKDYNAVLANIATTAERSAGAGGGPMGTASLQNIGTELRNISMDTAVPIEDLGDSVRNIFSSLQDVSEEDATKWARLFATGASLAETDAYNFGNAIISMKNAFGLANSDMEMIAGQFALVTRRSIGMTGDEWARQSGRIVAGATAANLSLAEMNAMMILMTQEGGTAATNVRHLSQLLMRMRTPTQESAPLWAAMGLSPATMARENMGGVEVIERIKAYIEGRFGQDALKVQQGPQFGEEFVAEAETLGQAGISGPAAQFIAELTGRMESARALAILLQQWEGTGKKDPGFNAFLEEALDTAKNLDEVQKRTAQRTELLHMQRAGAAIKAYRIEFVQQFEGIIKTIDNAIIKFAKWEDAPIAGLGTLAGLAAILGIAKGKGAVGKLLKGTPAAAIGASSILGGGVPTGAFSNPFWVMVMNPGWGKGPVGVPTGTPGGGWKGRLGKLFGNKWLRRGIKVGGPLAIIGALTDFFDAEDIATEDTDRIYKENTASQLARLRATPFNEVIKGQLWGAIPEARSQYIAGLDAAQLAIVRQRQRNQYPNANINGVSDALKPRGTPSVAGGIGAAMGAGGLIRIQLEPTAEAKRLVKGATVHVPYDHWSGGSYPGSRGGRTPLPTTPPGPGG